MNMSKQLFGLAVVGMFVVMVSGFVSAQPAKNTKQGTTSNKTVKADFSFLNDKTGTGPFSQWSEESLMVMLNNYLGTRIKKIIYDDSMAGSLAMLKSGRADFMLASDVSANYVIQRNPELKSRVFSDNQGLAMILRKSDGKLRDSINDAINKLKASGKLAGLYKKWITELPVGQDPAMPEIKATAYPETVYVGVSGDVPPLDYVAADGKPSGYNVALLAEISKLIGKNIEIVPLTSMARFAALKSKRIDVFFWLVGPSKTASEGGIKSFKEQLLTRDLIITEQYCAIKMVFLLKK